MNNSLRTTFIYSIPAGVFIGIGGALLVSAVILIWGRCCSVSVYTPFVVAA